ncbi:MAG: hypothetical protein DMG24_02220 [Acidobacteria bacterium]|nr:MAG: hypothetical protein DMG24_02220 [Acidobacteriota bacterium]
MKTLAVNSRRRMGCARRLRPRLRAGLRLVWLALVCASLPLSEWAARAQEAKLEINHLEKLAARAAEVVDVTLDAPMLRLASRFMSEERSPDEAAARELIKQLKGVYVKSFEFDKEGEYSTADVELIRAQLHAPWSRVVDVRSKREGENAEVYMIGGGDNITGLAIISAEPKELTVVNIVGPIDVEKLSQLEGHLGVPHLGLERSNKGRKEAANHEPTK